MLVQIKGPRASIDDNVSEIAQFEIVDNILYKEK